jgi:hypothetical protein
MTEMGRCGCEGGSEVSWVFGLQWKDGEIKGNVGVGVEGK